MKTTIWTEHTVARGAELFKPENKPRCVFNGDAMQLRAGDTVIIRRGLSEIVKHVYYDLTNNSQEVKLETSDKEGIYPTVSHLT